MNSKLISKLIVAAALVGLLAAFFHYDLGRYLTLEYLKAQQAAFQTYYEANRFEAIAIYFATYVVVTGLSLPGAAILTLAGGALFGFWTGLVVVSFASTAGATCALLVSRFLLRDFVQTRFRQNLTAINEGMERDGAFYLFSLRLIPAFPFFVVNLVMGLMPISAVKFFLVSQLGMLPGTAVFVNAGTQISKIETLKGILSPSLLLSFALLGLAPLVVKGLMSYFKNRKYLRRYKKPGSFDYNLVVIGAGSGGLVSAYIAAAVKAKVCLIEKHKMGGDCLNTGCVPSKALIKTATVLSHIRRHKEFGLKSASADFDFAEVMERVQKVIATIEPHDSIQRYTSLGVDCVKGTATIVSPFEVEVDGRTITTKNIVIATGGGPASLSIPGADKVKAYNSDTIWSIRKLPAKFLVLGGGPIGCELAQCFQRLGSQVTIVHRGPNLLPKEDREAADIVEKSFRRDGIDLRLGKAAKEFVVDGGKKYLVCDDGARIEFDECFAALGRKANVTGFGLEKLGVKLTKQGTVEVDPFLRTNYPNIFAVGDVAGPYQFTHTASHMAWYAAVNALFGTFRRFKVDYRVIPWCTFTDPEVARVGLSEGEAKEKGIPYEVSLYGIDDLDRAIADQEAHGVVKVLTVPGKDTILGAMITGPHAGDIIVEFVTAMKYGLGLNKILGTIHIYPTMGEANKYAAGVWKKAHAPQGLLKWVEKFHAWRR